MTDLELTPIEDIVKELRRRNISFLFAWADHQQFDKRNVEEGIVWGCEHGGNLILQMTILTLLSTWMHGVHSKRLEQPDPNEGTG